MLKILFWNEAAKNLVNTQLKQTNMENWLHILTESPNEGFNDRVFQTFRGRIKTAIPEFLCLYSMNVVMLPFRITFFRPVLIYF